MSIRPTVLGFALLCGALVLPSGPARAQEDPRKPQAETIFAEGIKLHDAGRNAEALEKYRRAYDVYPSANILFGIARLEQLLGRSLDSLRHYREALESPLLHPKNRELGKEYVAELEKQLGRFDVKAPRARPSRSEANVSSFPSSDRSTRSLAPSSSRGRSGMPRTRAARSSRGGRAPRWR